MAAVLVAAPPLEPRVPPNRVIVRARVAVSHDADSGLYTYRDSFTNDARSRLEVARVMIQLNGSSAVRVRAPRGWSSGVFSHQPILDFVATGGDPPPGWVNDGQPPPSPFQIKPGRRLSGFSFQSPDPPGATDFHAQGFTRLPVLGVDVEEDSLRPPETPVHPNQSFKGRTKGPHPADDLPTHGGDPAVEGFVAFRNVPSVVDRTVTVQVEVELGGGGETVDETTFRATLNNHDVTGEFRSIGGNVRRATFPPRHLYMNAGKRNVLVAFVDGVVAGGRPRIATDLDRVTIRVR